MKATTRAAIDARDGAACRRCGRSLYGQEFSRHHRKPRGMGGANRADANRLSNIVMLCGSATTPGSCHEWAESERALARASGWLVSNYSDPATIPVLTLAGETVWLGDSGAVSFGGPLPFPDATR